MQCAHGPVYHVVETCRSGCMTRVVWVTCVRDRISSVRHYYFVGRLSATARTIKVACNRQKHPPPSTVLPYPKPVTAARTRCRWHLNTRGDYTRAHGLLSSLNSNQMHKSLFRRRHCNHHHCRHCVNRIHAIHIHTHTHTFVTEYIINKRIVYCTRVANVFNVFPVRWKIKNSVNCVNNQYFMIPRSV